MMPSANIPNVAPRKRGPKPEGNEETFDELFDSIVKEIEER
jgi:hypothetical protein